MEPVETLEISNKLRQLEMDERREIHKILLELTALVHERLDLLWLLRSKRWRIWMRFMHAAGWQFAGRASHRS